MRFPMIAALSIALVTLGGSTVRAVAADATGAELATITAEFRRGEALAAAECAQSEDPSTYYPGHMVGEEVASGAKIGARDKTVTTAQGTVYWATPKRGMCRIMSAKKARQLGKVTLTDKGKQEIAAAKAAAGAPQTSTVGGQDAGQP